MRDDQHQLPVARIAPRDAAERMVIVRAHAARRAAQAGRVGIVLGKIAAMCLSIAVMAFCIGSTRTTTRFDYKAPEIKFPVYKFDDEAYRRLMIDLQKPMPELDPSQWRVPIDPPAKPAKKPLKRHRHPRP